LLHFGWRAIFWSLAGVSAVIFLFVGRYLPETRSPDETVRFSRSFHTYLDILKHRGFVGYTMTAGFMQAALFAYITGSSFVFIEYYGIAPEHFGWIFGSNAFGLIMAAQVNAWLLRRGMHPDTIMQRALYALAAFGVLLAIAAFAHAPLFVLLPPLFGFLTMAGMIFPNAGAGSLEHQKHRAGAASALAGMLQFCLSAVSAGLVSLLHAESPRPMAAVVAVCGLIACGIFMYMKKYRPPAATIPAETVPEA